MSFTSQAPYMPRIVNASVHYFLRVFLTWRSTPMAAEADRPAGAPAPQAVGPRGRGETLERAIYDAVLDELQRVGLTGLTMEGVAGCAHTGKAALDRPGPGEGDPGGGLPGGTVEGVAGGAHTGRAALSRRWLGKEDLVVDALDHSLPRLDDLPDHGNLRDDLLHLLRPLR